MIFTQSFNINILGEKSGKHYDMTGLIEANERYVFFLLPKRIMSVITMGRKFEFTIMELSWGLSH